MRFARLTALLHLLPASQQVVTVQQAMPPYDFGAAKFVDVFRTGFPDRIEEIRYNAGEEALRPVHFLEPNGHPVAPANHPQWVTWSGVTHFNSSVSPDRLNKPTPPPSIQAHGWLGKDNEHWSSLTLASADLLTTSFSLREELEHEANLYIAGHTLPSQLPNWPTNGMGPPRAVGRTFLSMTWNYLCTGRADLRARMIARMNERVFPQYAGLQPGITGPVRPFSSWR